MAFGDVELTGCPVDYVTADIWHAIHAAELALTHHLYPVAGGTLDQTAKFADLLRIVRPYVSV